MALFDPLIGKKLGDYTIQSLLGRGGMARVYRGYDENLDRYAAVKVISGDFVTGDEAEYTERFQREARAIARLSHTNIVGIYQYGQAEGIYYMAMAFLNGVDLREHIKEVAGEHSKIPVAEIVSIARDVAAALDYAHLHGVIHRDIKPSNIMLAEGKAVLTDFGLALNVPEGTMGDTFGTAHYIAPEQALSSAKAVPQSDLYSLAIILYELIAGRVPFDEPSAMNVALKHLNDPPPPPSLFNPDITPEIEQVLLKALSKDPTERYPTGEALVHAFEAATKGILEEETEEIQAISFGASADLFSSMGEELSLTHPDRPTTSGLNLDLESHDSHSEMSQTPGQRNTRLILGIGGIIIVVLLLGLIFNSQTLSEVDQNATAAQLAIIVRRTERAEDTATAEIVQTSRANQTETAIAMATDTYTPSPTDTSTFTRTPTPSDTPTRTPTDTQVPTSTDTLTRTPAPTDTPTVTKTPSNTPSPSPTNSPTPTRTPTATETPLPPQVRLVYNQDWVLIINISGGFLDLTRLRFVQESSLEGEEDIIFSTEDDLRLAGGSSQMSAVPNMFCYQVLIDPDDSRERIPLETCRSRLGWVAPRANVIFWTTDYTEITTFQAYVGRRKVADCEIDAGICEFSLQRQ